MLTPPTAGAQEGLICVTPLETAQRGCSEINTNRIFVYECLKVSLEKTYYIHIYSIIFCYGLLKIIQSLKTFIVALLSVSHFW